MAAGFLLLKGGGYLLLKGGGKLLLHEATAQYAVTLRGIPPVREFRGKPVREFRGVTSREYRGRK